MGKTRSPFDILGVTPADDMATIRMAWRAKVRALHPDRAKNKRQATAALADVNAAFDALQGHEPMRSKPVVKAQNQTRKRRVDPAKSRTAKDAPAPTRKRLWHVPEGATASLCQTALSGYQEARQNVKAA
ncbi:MAG: J domain-containing protein [Pseudomonadota bacterium]